MGAVSNGDDVEPHCTALKMISEAEKWMEMIEKRNLASHTYNENVLEESVEYIHLEFFPLAQKLYEDLRCKLQ